MRKNNTNNDLNSRVGRKVRELRQILNLTQSDLASKLNISYQQLYKYEVGVDNMSLKMLERISKSMDQQIKDIVPAGEEPERFVQLLSTMLNDAVEGYGERDLKLVPELLVFLEKPEAKDIKKSLVELFSSLEAVKAKDTQPSS